MKRQQWRWRPSKVGYGVMSGVFFGIASLVISTHLYAQQPSVAVHAQADASADAVLSRKVTIHLTNVSLKRAIDSVSRVAKVFVEYQLPLVRAYPGPVTVDATDMPLGVVLEHVLDGTSLRVVSAVQGSLAIVASSEGQADSVPSVGAIAGRVVDSATGRGVPGAVIKVVGTKLSLFTGDSGHFILKNVSLGDRTLAVRAFGYRPADRSVAVTGGTPVVIRVPLAAAPNVLSGVVTTATGQQRKVELGNDITTINADSVMRVAPVMSVTDLLETRVPGLTVMHSSGEPGSPSRLRLRGVGSITGNNDPIFIVDGVRVYSSQSDTRNDNLAPTTALPGMQVSVPSATNSAATLVSKFSAPSPIDQLDPNSIETIEVFKGPSASAMYGSDAANGVIVITTKRGHAGPTHWSLDLGQSVNWIPGDWPANYFRFGLNSLGQGPICNWYDYTCGTPDSIRTFQALNDSRYTVLDRGIDQIASLTISGGVPALQYNMTGSGSGQLGNLKLDQYDQQQYTTLYGSMPRWMVRPDRYSTWGVTGVLTAQPSPTFRVSLHSSMLTSSQQQSSLQGAITQLAGQYISNGAIYNYQGLVGPLATTPLVQNYVERVTGDQITSDNGITLGWQPRAWLPVTVTGGMQDVQRTDQTYVPYGVPNAGAIAGGCAGSAYVCSGETTGWYGLGRGLSHNATVSVSTIIPLIQQRVKLALGGNTYSNSTSDFKASTNSLAPGISEPTTFINPLGCGGSLPPCGTAGQNSSRSATYGWYVEPRLDLNSRFFASPGFRLDGGSGGTHSNNTGGAAGGLSLFPKLDFSYLAVDREGSPPLWGVLTQFRPRVAFGVAGTQPAPEDRLRLFNVGLGSNQLDPGGQGKLVGSACGSNVLNGVVVPTACMNTLGNTQLHPERSSQLEGGFDATLWNGRFTLTYTRYNKIVRDAIVSVPVAPSVSELDGSPFTIAENVGEVQNTGTELTLGTFIVENRALSWYVGANLSNNENILVHLNPGKDPSYALGLVPGYPLFGKWVRPIVASADQNGDNIIENNEIVLGDSMVFQGSPDPKYQLNLNTDVHLLSGRIGISATFAYQNGLTQTNQGALTSGSFYLAGNKPDTPLSYQAAVIAAACINNNQADANCSAATNYGLIQTVNTFRFDALSINYQLPQRVSAWFKVPRATVAVQGSNLALHSNYRGKDPDVNAFSTVPAGDRTADLGQIPEPRTWWLKLNLGNN